MDRRVWSWVLVLAAGCGDGGAVTPDGGGSSADGSAADSGFADSGPMARPTDVVWEATDLPEEGPVNLWGGAVADLGDGRAVLFGGTNATQTSGVELGGTWLYDVRDGTLRVTSLATDGPAPRYCGCVAWDPDRGRVVMTGGRDLYVPTGLPQETWELDPSTGAWELIPVPESPPGVVGCMMAYSGPRGAMYLFGGAGELGPSDVTYRYEPSEPRWLALPATGPSSRYDGVLQPLDGGRALLLFAGSYGAMGAAFYSDVWRFDTETETWTEVEIAGESPQGRRVPWVALTGDERGLYAAMGFDGLMRPIGDLWHLDLVSGAWTAIPTPGGPSARAFTQTLPGGPGALRQMLSGFDGEEPVREMWRLVAR